MNCESFAAGVCIRLSWGSLAIFFDCLDFCSLETPDLSLKIDCFLLECLLKRFPSDCWSHTLFLPFDDFFLLPKEAELGLPDLMFWLRLLIDYFLICIRRFFLVSRAKVL